MDLHWHYKRTEPFFAQGKDTTRPNFSRDERSQVGILVREALQNPLDIPRDDLSGPIRVALRHLKSEELDVDYLNEVFTPEFRLRLKEAGGVELPPAAESEAIVIEDFGTKGLIGKFDDYDADGPDQNWNAFWHREGEGAKGRASNGGAGQGKITYYAHSHAGTVLGLTSRSTDDEILLMGRASFLRDYPFGGGHKYYRAAYWTISDAKPTPQKKPDEIKRFKDAFRLSRESTQSGLSLVMPFAKPFEPKEALKAVMLDFYMPIVGSRLEVQIDNTLLSSETIDDIADNLITDEEVAATGSCFTKAYRAFARRVIANPIPQVALPPEWNKERTIPESVFPDGQLEKLRDALSTGGGIAIRLPLKIKRRNGVQYDTTFDVYIEAPSDLDRNEEAFVRRDLLIGAESHVTAGSFVQKTRSLTWIQDKDLSDFLLTAEEPTHLVWNASLARDRGEYVSPDIALRSIRQAVPRLLMILLGGSDKKDFKSMARFFSRPATDPTTTKGGSGQKKTKPDIINPPPPPPPPPPPKPFRVDSVGPTIRVNPTTAMKLSESQLPLRVLLELAYEGLDQDPFEAYDPYDFDVSNTAVFPVIMHGMSVISREGNRVELEISDSDFGFEIAGLDANVRTRARLTYDLPDDDE